MRAVKKKLDFITSTIPQKTSELVNDAGFLTAEDNTGGVFVIQVNADWGQTQNFDFPVYELWTPYGDILAAFQADKTLVIDAPYFTVGRVEYYTERFNLSKWKETSEYINMLFTSENGFEGISIRVPKTNFGGDWFEAFPIVLRTNDFDDAPSSLSLFHTFGQISTAYSSYEGQFYITNGTRMVPIDLYVGFNGNSQSVSISYTIGDRIVSYYGTGTNFSQVVLSKDPEEHPDWSINDPDTSGYIENRTHWLEETLVQVFAPATLSITSNGGIRISASHSLILSPTAGDTLIVWINGTRYELVAESVNNQIKVIGDNFNITFNSYDITLSHNSMGEYLVSIYKQTSAIYHQLDSRYIDLTSLPSGGTTVTVTDDSAGTVTMSISTSGLPSGDEVSY